MLLAPLVLIPLALFRLLFVGAHRQRGLVCPVHKDAGCLMRTSEGWRCASSYTGGYKLPVDLSS